MTKDGVPFVNCCWMEVRALLGGDCEATPPMATLPVLGPPSTPGIMISESVLLV